MTPEGAQHDLAAGYLLHERDQACGQILVQADVRRRARAIEHAIYVEEDDLERWRWRRRCCDGLLHLSWCARSFGGLSLTLC